MRTRCTAPPRGGPIALALLLLPACSTPAGPTPPDLAAPDLAADRVDDLRQGGPTDLARTDLTPAAPLSTRFQSIAQSFSVPSHGSVAGFAALADGTYGLVDLDGDRRPDLVQTRAATDPKVFGGDTMASWKLFVNNGAGFQRIARSFSVPSYGDGIGFASLSAQRHALVDLDGDGRVDLVQTAAAGSDVVFGGDGDGSWKFFRNTGTGFSSIAQSWTVPSYGDGKGFAAVGSARHALVDLDGDGRVDLVQTAAAGSDVVFGGDGDGSWKFFRNTGSGFARIAQSWTVPSYGDGKGFARPADARYAVVDLDGDGRVDLVQTAAAGSNVVFGGDGSPVWKLFANSGSGFQRVARSFSLPRRGDPSGYAYLGGVNYFVQDLDGDGRPDLVETTPTGQPTVYGGDANGSWKLFPNSAGTGFGTTARTFSVPSYGEAQGFNAPSGQRFGLVDLDGDGRVDLVQTAAAGQSTVYGGDMNASWKWFRSIP